MNFWDTHCHLYEEYYENIEKVIEESKLFGVTNFIVSGCDAKSNAEVLSILSRFSFCYGVLGIHPEEVLQYESKDLELLEKSLNNKKILGIGEIGLDYHYTKENKEAQIKLFETQLALAEKYHMPVIIHSREATEDTINTLKKYKVTGVIHSFSGSLETANIYIKMGFLLGINGVITFKNSKLKDTIKDIDLNNIILETDSPYLAPTPHRGEKNEPANVSLIAEFISELKNISLSQLSIITNENIKRIFDI